MILCLLVKLTSFAFTSLFPIILTIKSIKTDNHHHLKFFLHYWLIVSIIYQVQLTFSSSLQQIPYFEYFVSAVKLWLLIPYSQGCVITCYCYLFPLLLNSSNESHIESFFECFFKSSLFALICNIVVSLKMTSSLYLKTVYVIDEINYIYKKPKGPHSGGVSFLDFSLNKICYLDFSAVAPNLDAAPAVERAHHSHRSSRRSSAGSNMIAESLRNELKDIKAVIQKARSKSPATPRIVSNPAILPNVNQTIASSNLQMSPLTPARATFSNPSSRTTSIYVPKSRSGSVSKVKDVASAEHFELNPPGSFPEKSTEMATSLRRSTPVSSIKTSPKEYVKYEYVNIDPPVLPEKKSEKKTRSAAPNINIHQSLPLEPFAPSTQDDIAKKQFELASFQKSRKIKRSANNALPVTDDNRELKASSKSKHIRRHSDGSYY